MGPFHPRPILAAWKAPTPSSRSTRERGLLPSKSSWDSDCYLELLPNKKAEFRTKLSSTISNLSRLEKPQLSSTGSAAAAKIAKTWLQTCSTHRACQPPITSTFVPTRLLYVGRVSDPTCRLVERFDLDGPVMYFVLSNCWENDVQVTLTVGNYPLMKNEAVVASLSQNFS